MLLRSACLFFGVCEERKDKGHSSLREMKTMLWTAGVASALLLGSQHSLTLLFGTHYFWTLGTLGVREFFFVLSHSPWNGEHEATLFLLNDQPKQMNVGFEADSNCSSLIASLVSRHFGVTLLVTTFTKLLWEFELVKSTCIVEIVLFYCIGYFFLL